MVRAEAGTDPAAGLPLQLQAEAVLRRGGLRLAFPPELERQYRHDTAAERAQELRFIALIGASLYAGLGILVNTLLVVHPDWRAVAVQLAGAFAFVMLVAFRFFRAETPDGQRETAIFICCLACALGAIAVVALKPAPVTLKDFVLAALPVNFILIFVRLRFTAASLLLAICLLAYGLTILHRSELPPHAKLFPIGFMLLLCGPALLGLHTLERTSRRLYLHGLLQRLNYERVTAENVTLAGLSVTDPLTGVANRRRLDAALEAMCAAPGLQGSLLLLDIDAFKAFNDRYGHPAGDVCLCAVTDCLAARLRRRDLLARFGGEEFAVLLPETTLREAMDTAERLRQAVEADRITVNGLVVSVTISIGVAAADGSTSAAALLARADGALYAAKRAGRNRVSADAFEKTA